VEEAKHILGAQGNVWTEYIPTTEQAEYMAFPRAIALAERTWSPKEQRDYDGFASRLSRHMERLDLMNVNYANHLFEVKTDITSADNGLNIRLSSLAPDAKIYYTLDGTEPGASATEYTKPIKLTENKTLKSAVYRNGKLLSRVQQTDFQLHKAAAKNISLTNEPHPTYSLGGKAALINGVVGSDDRYGDGEWLGWSGQNFEAIIDLGTSQDLSNLQMRFYNGQGQWIYLPREVKVAISDDAKSYRTVATQRLDANNNQKVVSIDIPLKASKGQFLKVTAQKFGFIPEGAQGAGNEAWLFVDELVLE